MAESQDGSVMSVLLSGCVIIASLQLLNLRLTECGYISGSRSPLNLFIKLGRSNAIFAVA